MTIYVYLFICVRKILIQLFDNENRWRLKFNIFNVFIHKKKTIYLILVKIAK